MIEETAGSCAIVSPLVHPELGEIPGSAAGLSGRGQEYHDYVTCALPGNGQKKPPYIWR